MPSTEAVAHESLGCGIELDGRESKAGIGSRVYKREGALWEEKSAVGKSRGDPAGVRTHARALALWPDLGLTLAKQS